VSLPPTAVRPPNAVVVVQPGMQVQAVCIITPPAGALLTAGQGGRGNVSVTVQPGMAVRAVVLVNSAGHFVSY
jgi:hypothetical protein